MEPTALSDPKVWWDRLVQQERMGLMARSARKVRRDS
jgi:hypothetical protein